MGYVIICCFYGEGECETMSLDGGEGGVDQHVCFWVGRLGNMSGMLTIQHHLYQISYNIFGLGQTFVYPLKSDKYIYLTCEEITKVFIQV